jgi:elongation factor Ts
MATISAADVKALRDKTGLPMMDCKAALVEAGGDHEKATEILRKKGAAAAERKADRETAEGRIGCYVDRQRGVGALVELRCETAPVANNEGFVALANELAKSVALADGDTDVETLLARPVADDPAKTIRDRINDTVNVLRENMGLARAARLEGTLASYVHHNGQVGVLTKFEADRLDPQLAADICMQIAAMHPLAVSRDRIDPELVKKELEIARDQAAQTGKPEAILEKIAQGKLNKWYATCVLLEQPFVRDDKKTVEQVLKAAGGVVVKDFVRLQVGVIA